MIEENLNDLTMDDMRTLLQFIHYQNVRTVGANERLDDTAEKMIKEIQIHAASNMKRVVVRKKIDWYGSEAETPYFIMDTQEIKTTWHPVGI